jgi:hypothetical protein
MVGRVLASKCRGRSVVKLESGALCSRCFADTPAIRRRADTGVICSNTLANSRTPYRVAIGDCHPDGGGVSPAPPGGTGDASNSPAVRDGAIHVDCAQCRLSQARPDRAAWLPSFDSRRATECVGPDDTGSVPANGYGVRSNGCSTVRVLRLAEQQASRRIDAAGLRPMFDPGA